MFDQDAAVAVALVLAKCSPEDWIFDQNFDRSPQTRQNIEDLSKYWRLVKIYQTDLIRQYFESMYFLTKNLPHTVKNPVKNFDVNFLLQYIDGFFDRVWAYLAIFRPWCKDGYDWLPA